MARAKKIRDSATVAAVTVICALLLKTFVVEAYRIPSGSMENTLKIGDLVLVNKLAYGLRTPGMFPFTSINLEPTSLVSLRDVQRGEVVVFESTIHKSAGGSADMIFFVKRCIGIPGDSISIRQGRVFVNGLELLSPETGIAPSFRSVFHRQAMYPSGAGFTDVDYGPIRVPSRGELVDLDPTLIEWWRPLLEREGRTVEIADDGTVRVDGWTKTSYMLEDDYYFMLGDNRDNSADSRMWGFVARREIVGEALMVYWSTADGPESRGVETGSSSVRWGRVGSLVR